MNRAPSWRLVSNIGSYVVSTYELPLAHSPVRPFETSVLRGEDDEQVAVIRHRTRDEARTGHAAMTSRVRAGEFGPIGVAS